MEIIFWVAGIIGLYFFIVFVCLRLAAPFIGFWGYKYPTDLPLEMRQVVNELESQAQNQTEYLEKVYALILDKTLHQWKHTRFKAGTRPDRLFVKDLKEIWNTSDFLYCQAINFAALALLFNSKFFSREDIKIKHVFFNFVPHQYLQVRIEGNWINFDPTGTGIRGKPLGTYGRFIG